MKEETCEVCGGAIHSTADKWWHDDVVSLGWYSHPERRHDAVRKNPETAPTALRQRKETPNA